MRALATVIGYSRLLQKRLLCNITTSFKNFLLKERSLRSSFIDPLGSLKLNYFPLHSDFAFPTINVLNPRDVSCHPKSYGTKKENLHTEIEIDQVHTLILTISHVHVEASEECEQKQDCKEFMLRLLGIELYAHFLSSRGEITSFLLFLKDSPLLLLLL